MPAPHRLSLPKHAAHLSVTTPAFSPPDLGRAANNTPHTGQRHHFRHRAASTAQSRDVCGDHTRFHVCNMPSLNLSPERASCAQREDQGEEPPDVAPRFADEVNPTVSWFPSALYRVFSESIALEIHVARRR
ncbi:hypothetical protein B0H13DRAFT_2340471 [Mycena leptocephala]|nr:hypothetical protein B0H13DRAFT_2340471 [Mycena leptocephala]